MPGGELVLRGRRRGHTAAGRVLPRLRIHHAGRASRHLSAHPRFPAPHGVDDAGRLPLSRRGPGPRSEPHRAAPADRRHREAGDPRQRGRAQASSEGQDVRAPDLGSLGRRGGLGLREHEPAPRQGVGVGGRRRPRVRPRARCRGRVVAGRRPRPELRRRLGRSQPDPHVRPDGKGARLPAPDRTRHVDQGALRRGARAAAARRRSR